MKYMQKHETTKLHYGKYLYKLKCKNALAGIFRTELQRSKTLDYARQQLDIYNAIMESGAVVKKSIWRTDVVIPEGEVVDANTIYRYLKNAKDEYIIRCEYSYLTIYSNDATMLLNISKKLNSQVNEFWQPAAETISFLKQNSNVILVDKKPELPYKVTFGRKAGSPELARWLKNNTNKARAGSTFIRNCEESNWISGQYVYVRDESILFFIQMIAGNNIIKVDKLIYRGDIDK